MNFIKTSDPGTINTLQRLGFVIAAIDGDIYTFIVAPHTNFEKEIDKSKIVYSNVMCI